MGAATNYWNMASDAVSKENTIVEQNNSDAKSSDTESIWKKLKNFRVFGYTGNSAYDDDIEIQAGSKTLLGNDFSTLYESSDVTPVSAVTADNQNTTVNIIRSSSSYPTEMHSGDLRMSNWTEYSAIPVNKRAAYEVALLTKKYAVLDETGINEKAYADQMAQYRQYCESNNISWDSVISSVSGEFQTEVADYKNSSGNKSWINAVKDVSGSAEKNKAQAADAHNLLLSCAPDGYKDELLPALSGKIEYADTCDATYDTSISAKSSGFFAAVASFFKAAYEKLPHPVEWAKSVFSSVSDGTESYMKNLDALSDDFEQDSEKRQKEGREVLEQLNGAKKDISSTKAGVAASDAGNAVKEEVKQVFADPSQEIQDARTWTGEKSEQAAPYVNAAENAAKTIGQNAKNRVDAFVEKWSDPNYTSGSNSSDDYEETMP